MINKKVRNDERVMRHARSKKNLRGTAERPRLNVFKSHKNICVQVIDDTAGKTLLTVSTLEKDIKQSLKVRSNLTAAKQIGAVAAQRSLAKGIAHVIFDRGGNRYHGAVKALAEAAREAGLKF
jgi:large subunit ribosomal protein L18